ncbi:hypothetical protein EDB82DRAFT_556830 [Fusarium venenatum]|uniref:uncharacterized protein n=1 Tax=Fusarium venenatum TaxID=56646 RepID=UPI001DE02B42|nr:hypothetical protein EDB82DRAFT_556830 [Fusarium venenatum]
MFVLFSSPGLLFLLLLLRLVQAQVSTNKHGIPTLVYNCAKVPALCQNVNKLYPLETTVHVLPSANTAHSAPSASSDHSAPLATTNAPPATVTGLHTIQGTQTYIQLHLDRDTEKKNKRRSKACPGSWRQTHPCPESNQPETVPKGAILGDGSFPPARWNPNNILPGENGYNRIANAAGQYSGMMWTCDEFPFARDNAVDAPLKPMKKKDVEGIWRFHFYTQFDADAGSAALVVRYYDARGNQRDKGYMKRALNGPHIEESIVQIDHGFHNNGTVEVKHKPLFKDEYKLLRRSWDQHLPGNCSAVGPEEGILKRSIGQMLSRGDDGTVDMTGRMNRRQSEQQCDYETPCPDGSCCNNMGHCGYGEEACGENVCVSNCDAKAECGKDSLDGSYSCPLNVCCSTHGYCGVGDEFCQAGNQDDSCQEGFGSCTRIEPPSCQGASTLVRSIGYYNFANLRFRQCNRITPKQIRTEGFTHLYGAFAAIDPDTFAVKPWHEDDLELYKEFTGLKNKGLETWIAIGDRNVFHTVPTRTSFSYLSATPAGRSQFITYLTSFLDEHGFQGVDRFWQYPGVPGRGGRWEDLKEIEKYVDHMSILTFDLHGPWDEHMQFGRVILGHTNIPEIANLTLPLYYAGVDPGKVNLGLSYYGRGYTVSDSNCNGIFCEWSGPSRPTPCTNEGGVMSLEEIERMVEEEPGMEPTFVSGDLMMELKFGNQWIGYDNNDTIAYKKGWASGRCFGGTTVWSVDEYSGSGSGDTPDDLIYGGSDDSGGGQGVRSGMIYIDPEIWEGEQPEVNCQPPCTMVLPPSSLETPVELTFPPYETSLDVAWNGTDGWHSTIQKTILTPPVVTVTAVDVWHITIREDLTNLTDVWSTFTITPSVKVPPFIITNTVPETTNDGATQPPGTRTITAPPYPWTNTKPATEPQTSGTSDDNVLPLLFPVVTWRPGKPGPRCKMDCGKPCRVFCDHPCLLDYPDGGRDFPDPQNPNPPRRPVPPNPPIPDPTNVPTPGVPENEEDQENERQCALEFGLPLPTWRNPATTTSVKPMPAPPRPSPKPNPKPPSPNPQTEEVHCYNDGASIDHALAIEALESFCDRFEGQVLDATKPGTERTLQCKHGVGCLSIFGCSVDVVMSVTVINGCRFTIGNKGSKSECGRNLRRMIDECDTSDTRYKQGGTMTSNCAIWRFDPMYPGGGPSSFC